MASIELRASTAVEFALFRKFAETLVSFEKNHVVSKKEFYHLLAYYLGGNMTGENLANLFSKAKISFSIEEWRFSAFCKKFDSTYNSLPTIKKDAYKELKDSFDNWKNDLERRHGVSLGQQQTVQNTVLPLKTYPFLVNMEKSVWYAYALHETWKSPVIGRMVITFGEHFQNQIDVTLTHYNQKYGVWKGKAFGNSDSSIIITITQEPNQTGYTHYLMSVWPQASQHDLFIGQMTRKNSKLTTNVSKIVLLEKCNDPKPVAKKFDLNSQDLPIGFTDFFQLKELQPLVGAPIWICDYKSFTTWLDEKRNNQRGKRAK